jgi:hypothetical protein
MTNNDEIEFANKMIKQMLAPARLCVIPYKGKRVLVLEYRDGWFWSFVDMTTYLNPIINEMEIENSKLKTKLTEFQTNLQSIHDEAQKYDNPHIRLQVYENRILNLLNPNK